MMKMKFFKIFCILSLFITATACQSQKKQTTNTLEEKDTLSQVPQYEYSDDFYNKNFVKDEQNNIYFKAGQYYYQLDSKNNLKQLFQSVIDNQYYIYDVKYAHNQFYLLVVKVNHQYKNSPLGLATIDMSGNHFTYLDDLIYLDNPLPLSVAQMRINDDKIYLIDTNEKSVYIYSLESKSIQNKQPIDINETRYNFYKKYFPHYPYNSIEHIYNNHFYQINTLENDKKVYIEYDPINHTEKQFDIDEYYDSSKQIEFYIDLVNNHWFLFSGKGIFQFDLNFENKEMLLDESIFHTTYTLTPTQDNEIILEARNEISKYN